MKLSECVEGQEICITSINTDRITKKRLGDMGINSGESLFVLRENGGSVLVVKNGKMFALGRAVCEEVSVSACCDNGKL